MQLIAETAMVPITGIHLTLLRIRISIEETQIYTLLSQIAMAVWRLE